VTAAARTALVALTAVCVAACAKAPEVRTFAPADYPERLSEWGIVTARGNALVMGADVLPYDLATPLFTDFAHKLRTVWMPPGTRAVFDDTTVFEMPVGTVLSKTFFYPRADRHSGAAHDAQPDTVALTEDPGRDFVGAALNLGEVRLIETRLLVHQPDGWDALPYVWDEARGDAFLTIAGAYAKVDAIDADGRARAVDYIVPTRNECASCHASDHTSGALHPIGIAARHLAKDYEHYEDGPAPQLSTWVAHGYLDRAPEGIRANAIWRAGAHDGLEHRARSYLDINCGHCHSAVGAADTSGLHLDMATADARRLGVCKPPVAAGRGSGGHAYSIVPGNPGASILVYRLASDDPAVRMPELGRTTTHTDAVTLIERWIESLPGECITRT
jgi:uncharacterized repeat protein (TIGR03806 family)